jgi:hypothetical protein
MGYDPFTANLMLWGFAVFLTVMAGLTVAALCLRAAGITIGGARPPGPQLSATFRFSLPAGQRSRTAPARGIHPRSL